jgi:hypothetical protein
LGETQLRCLASQRCAFRLPFGMLGMLGSMIRAHPFVGAFSALRAEKAPTTKKGSTAHANRRAEWIAPAIEDLTARMMQVLR